MLRGPEVAAFSSDTALSSNATNATLTLNFTGTAVSWIGGKCNVCGIASVSIDGGPPVSVDTAGPAAPGDPGLKSQPVFTASGLAPGAHTLTITVTGGTGATSDRLRVDNGTSNESNIQGADLLAGGTITIQGLASPAQSILIDAAASGIFTETQGTGAGGGINIFTQSLTVQNGGMLSAKTSGPVPEATRASPVEEWPVSYSDRRPRRTAGPRRPEVRA